jgi:hypothetical protein
MSTWFGKIRPQIFLAIVVLGAIAGAGIRYDMAEVTGVASAGIIALGMKVLEAE